MDKEFQDEIEQQVDALASVVDCMSKNELLIKGLAKFYGNLKRELIYAGISSSAAEEILARGNLISKTKE